jgi:heme/copper-type cytochrome/quinol oxidase subunit 3
LWRKRLRALQWRKVMPNTLARQVEYLPDGLNLILGILLFVSPWALEFAGNEMAAWNAWIGGAVVAALALAALTQFAQWEEWVNTVLGVWLAASPWILGFEALQMAMWSHVVLGVLITLLAAWRGWTAHRRQTQKFA